MDKVQDLKSSATEDEEHSVCSQCEIFQQERDERTRKYDESRTEIERLRYKVLASTIRD